MLESPATVRPEGGPVNRSGKGGAMAAVVVLAAILLTTAGVTVPSAKAQGPGNAILIEDMGKPPTAPDRRPFQVSRVFAQGEIPACAQASVGGVPVETQCNVKGRWRDGSLKHAILTFWAELPARDRIQADFIPAECRDDGPGLSREEILNYLDGQWGAVIEAKANVEDQAAAGAVANVRRMLEEWDGQASESGVRYWLQGRLATQLIVEDRSPASKYDFGWKPEWPALMTAAAITAKDETIKIQPAYAGALASWKFPVTVYLGTERIRLCSASGTTLTVCGGGRGADGTKASTQAAGRLLGADAGWRSAPEDRFRSLHPIFVVTIYPGWSGVKVDTILENVWATRLQDQIYFARIGRGASGADTAWTKNVIHVAQSRWRKTVWNGEPLPETRIDHNFPYLIYSGAVPSYDLEITLAPSAVRAEQETYTKSDRGEVNGFGVWQPAMPTTGGRGDIGLIPRWYVEYLYTADHTLQKALFANADVSGYVPIHIRESLDERRAYVKGREASAAGRPISIDARPTTYVRSYDYTSGVRSSDRITPVGPTTSGGWIADMAHHPAMVYLPYLLSGDWYYLEEQQFWAAYALASIAPGVCGWCRNDSLGYLYGSTELRAEAWMLRTLAEAAFVSEDRSPEKDYFESKLRNNIAAREGKLDVHNGSYYEPAPDCAAPCSTTAWRYGKDYPGRQLPNPLHFAEFGANGGFKDPTINYAVTLSEGSPWQHHYLHVSYAHIQDLGYVEIEPQRRALAENLIGQIMSPDYNAYLAAEYRMPLMDKATNQFFTKWGDVLNGFNEPYRSSKEFPAARLSSPYHYPYVLTAALSCAVGFEHPQGFSSWEAYRWARGQLKYELLGLDPTWALVPRVSASAPVSVAQKVKPKWYKTPASFGIARKARTGGRSVR